MAYVRRDETNKKDFRQDLTNEIIKMIEAGTAPWQKPWDAAVGNTLFDLPQNAATGRRYQGANTLHLMMKAQQMGHSDDPRWCTFKQANEKGWKIKKGSKGTTVEYWKFQKTVDESEGQTDEKEGPVKPSVFYATVFHASQIEGIPAFESKRKEEGYEWEPNAMAEAVLKESGAEIFNDQVDRAYYSPSTDEIHLPTRAAFENETKYYSTALHELGHWTGHKSRMARDLTGRFGSESYAKEELRAEMASMFLAAEIGVPFDPGQHAAYQKSWIKVLKEDKNEIFRAAKDAERITDYVIGISNDIKREGVYYGRCMTNDPSRFIPDLANLVYHQSDELMNWRNAIKEMESGSYDGQKGQWGVGISAITDKTNVWEKYPEIKCLLEKAKSNISNDEFLNFVQEEIVERTLKEVERMQKDIVQETSKKSVKEIWIERVEGPIGNLSQDQRETKVKTFAEADAFLREQAKSAGNFGCDKTDFKVIWEDGSSYQGCYDLKRIDLYRTDLLQNHMKDEIEFLAGIHRPAHFKDDSWQRHLSELDPAEVEKRKEQLRDYEGLNVQRKEMGDLYQYAKAYVPKALTENEEKPECSKRYEILINQFMSENPGLANELSYSTSKVFDEVNVKIAGLMLQEGYEAIDLSRQIKENSPLLNEMDGGVQTVSKAFNDHLFLKEITFQEYVQKVVEEKADQLMGFISAETAREQASPHSKTPPGEAEYQRCVYKIARENDSDLPIIITPTLDSMIAKKMFEEGYAREDVMDGLKDSRNVLPVNRTESEYPAIVAAEAQLQVLYKEGKSSNEAAKEMILKDYPKKDITNALMKHAPNMPERSDEARKEAQKIIRSADRQAKKVQTQAQGIAM